MSGDVDRTTRRQTHNLAAERLLSYEKFWKEHFHWLESHGYQLRPRYHPNWVPSWRGTEKFCRDFEDGWEFPFPPFIDATRISDGALVALKKVSKPEHPHEADIARLLSSEPLASDSRNHSVPVYEILHVPDDDEDLDVIVMPFLRAYNDPHFDTFGEVVAFFHQVFEGLQFLHEHLIAHRDCNGCNIMLDPSTLYPNSFHPVCTDKTRDFKHHVDHFTRTQRSCKYYFIDFGLSRRYKPEDMPPLEPIIRGGDKSAPEHQEALLARKKSNLCNPFPTDVYYIGNMILEDFIRPKQGFEFMKPLINDMIQADPEKRPTMDQVMSRFDETRKSLSESKLRSRVVQRGEKPLPKIFFGLGHLARRVQFILGSVPPA
ncbi:hypothetical protein JAAARDRAFT_133274 [Jaapia argillacea MUCL 33604]|uniref:Protein kinase domain-containing protein n=1 Tax=Jaapia argillacea MUCL 33604 TaxID=933084 RepID=A0A067PLG2_9AGAM|nr:hypothetical protein JAAARDRAFT_133274 [Jaapia argillacea MUCL 33604]